MPCLSCEWEVAACAKTAAAMGILPAPAFSRCIDVSSAILLISETLQSAKQGH
jgi:hypothetical protein